MQLIAAQIKELLANGWLGKEILNLTIFILNNYQLIDKVPTCTYITVCYMLLYFGLYCILRGY